MRFILTYDGELRSNADYRKKWEIRAQLHPQLQELWNTTSSLQMLIRHRWVPRGETVLRLGHHYGDTGLPESVAPMHSTDLDILEPIVVGGRQFNPLVRNTLALKCSLKITFLRKELPGKVYQGGDIDNRLKTLLDALAVPNKDQIVDDESIDDPIYCLLEDDCLISRLDVDSRQLLSRPSASKHEVHLVIDVDVRVTDPRAYNQFFLGD